MYISLLLKLVPKNWLNSFIFFCQHSGIFHHNLCDVYFTSAKTYAKKPVELIHIFCKHSGIECRDKYNHNSNYENVKILHKYISTFQDLSCMKINKSKTYEIRN